MSNSRRMEDRLGFTCAAADYDLRQAESLSLVRPARSGKFAPGVAARNAHGAPYRCSGLNGPVNYVMHSESTLLQRMAAGDPSAVEGCLAKYRGLVWSIARRFGGDYADAEDAVQEVFIELWRHAGRFDPALASESTFIGTIARRRLIDRKRRQSSRPRLRR